jgi:branched-chain amino acid transport system substrate-binding protein
MTRFEEMLMPTMQSPDRRALLARGLASGLCAMGLPLAQASPRPLAIGVSLSLSGRYAPIGDMQSKAYRLWERHVNGRGGILGRRVAVVILDDGSDPEKARALYTDFVTKDEVAFVFGPYSSAITAAVAPIVDRHGFPMLAAGAAADEIWKNGYTNVIGMWSPAGRYAIGFLAILSERHIGEIAIVTADDLFSASVAEGARKWAPQYGVQPTSFITVSKANPDMERAATEARASGAEVLVMAGHIEESISMRTALRRLGWGPRAFYASVGPALTAYRERLGPDADGSFSTSVWEPTEDLRMPDSPQFLRAFVTAYGMTPSYHAATAYAAGQILEKAILRAGRPDRDEVRKALFTMDTTSILGRHAVDRTGVQTKRFPMIVQWQAGERKIVWPPEVQTAAPLLT